MTAGSGGAGEYVTAEVRALIGATAGPFEAPDAVERGAIRRFAQAAMDEDRLYWDDAYAARTRFGRVVAPPLFPLYLFRPAPGTPDPLAGSADPEFDGTGDNFLVRFGLPPLPIPLTRFLNGGNRLRFFRCAEVGDRIVATSRYLDVYEKRGASGPLVFAIAEATFANQRGEVLLICEQTLIWR